MTLSVLLVTSSSSPEHGGYDTLSPELCTASRRSGQVRQHKHAAASCRQAWRLTDLSVLMRAWIH